MKGNVNILDEKHSLLCHESADRNNHSYYSEN